jgi:hypothetical protein
MMVIENPMQLTMVNEVPLDLSGACCAINVENNGESAITANPHINKNTINTFNDCMKRKNGETIQHIQEMDNDAMAVFFTPKYCDSIPLHTQAIPPDAMMKNDNKNE